MKLHKNLNTAVVNTLAAIFLHNKYADKALEYTLQSDKRWGARDRAYIAETTYEIVRWWRLLTEATGGQPTTEEQFWKPLGAWLAMKNIEVPAWPEFYNVEVRKIREQIERLSKLRRYSESVPDWLDQLGDKELGDQWPEQLHALNQQAEVVLRVNLLKTTVKDLQIRLKDESFDTDKLANYPDALQLRQRQNVFRSASFKEGMFEVQDANSQLVGAYLGVEPGQRVVDACAGGGGKTLHLAALMQNKGKIVALDTEEWKLGNLKLRARRAGAGNIETKTIDSHKVVKRLYDSADRLLLDVPCSGLGVLKRNPDAKWKLGPEFIEKVKTTQQEIIQKYSPIVRTGGQMVYSTCSILPSENHLQVKAFLASEAGKSFELVKDQTLMPADSGYDGFYMALLRKKG